MINFLGLACLPLPYFHVSYSANAFGFDLISSHRSVFFWRWIVPSHQKRWKEHHLRQESLICHTERCRICWLRGRRNTKVKIKEKLLLWLASLTGVFLFLLLSSALLNVLWIRDLAKEGVPNFRDPSSLWSLFQWPNLPPFLPAYLLFMHHIGSVFPRCSLFSWQNLTWLALR